MIAGSLFSGVGGLDHGLHRAGFRHAFLCESDPWRRTVLAAHWPGVPVYADVRAVGAADVRLADEQHEGHQLGGEVALMDAEHAGQSQGAVGVQDTRRLDPAVDLLCGGFPCQDVSVAGQRRGLAGNRSGLFYEFARIIDALRPRWVLVENVPGLFSSNGGRDFGAVVGTLADVGYGVGWRVLDSRFFGVPQRRRRVFILGAVAVGDPRAAAERAGQVLAVGTRCDRHPPAGTEAGEDVAVASLSGLGSGGPDDNDGQAGRLVALPEGFDSNDRTAWVDEVAPTLTSRQPVDSSNRQTGVLIPPVSLALNAKRGKRDAGESETFVTAFRTQEPIHGDEFTPALGETSIGMGVGIGATVRRLTPTECERLQALPDGWTNPDGTAPDSRRYAALGDAVTSSVGEWLGRRIIAAEAAA